MTIESDAVKLVAGMMARTAPKAVGIDSISIKILTGKEQANLANQMIKLGKELGLEFFRLNGEQVKESDATILIGVEGRKGLGINCGGCGFTTCAEMAKAVANAEKKNLICRPKLCLKNILSRYCCRICGKNCKYP